MNIRKYSAMAVVGAGLAFASACGGYGYYGAADWYGAADYGCGSYGYAAPVAYGYGGGCGYASYGCGSYGYAPTYGYARSYAYVPVYGYARSYGSACGCGSYGAAYYRPRSYGYYGYNPTGITISYPSYSYPSYYGYYGYEARHRPVGGAAIAVAFHHRPIGIAVAHHRPAGAIAVAFHRPAHINVAAWSRRPSSYAFSTRSSQRHQYASYSVKHHFAATHGLQMLARAD
jgi:hypothetical protein